MTDEKYITTQLQRATVERVDTARSNLIRIGVGSLPAELQALLSEHQIDASRINRSAVIEIALTLLEQAMEGEQK